MPSTIQRIRVLLSSPMNLKNDREIVSRVVDELNLDRGSREDFFIELVKWETHTRPAAGEYAQGIINQQFPKDIDIFLGMMGAYFGTPTKYWGSGTEEEFRLAFAANRATGEPEMMFYFSEGVVDLSSIDAEQLIKRNKFKENIGNLGVKYEKYLDVTSLHILVRRHLNMAISDVLEKKTPDDAEEVVPDQTSDVLARFNQLLRDDPMVAVDELFAQASEFLTSHTNQLNSLTDNTNRLSRNLQKSVAQLAHANKTRNLKAGQKALSGLYDAFRGYQRKLSKLLPGMDENFRSSMVFFQRAIEITRNEHLEELIPIEEPISALNGLRESYSFSLEAVVKLNHVVKDSNDYQGDLEIQQKRIIALHEDLGSFLDRSIQLMDQILGFVDSEL